MPSPERENAVVRPCEASPSSFPRSAWECRLRRSASLALRWTVAVLRTLVGSAVRTVPGERLVRTSDPTNALLTGAVLLVAFAFPCVALAQDAKKAAGVFDDEPAKPKAKAKAEPKAKAAATKGAVSDRDSIGFTQENVAAQMTELEERMFRLSEALRSLEPENAARLRLALKFSREELILQQMKETQGLMKEAQLSKAETEVRELLAKLEHLRSLLLAEDLDFQMKLARLRQMREALSQLDRIVKEERRELAWSRTAVEQQQERKRLQDLQASLEALVRDQKTVIAITREAGEVPEPKARLAARENARQGETAVRKKADSLAADPPLANLAPPYLKQADPHLGDADTYLGNDAAASAAGSERKALDLFEKELERLNGQIAQTDKGLAAAEFRHFEQDQARNRGATDALAAVSSRLGNSGVPLQKDLIRAGGSMQAAEGDLARTAAKPAADDQLAALKHLVKAREDLAKSVEGLLVGVAGQDPEADGHRVVERDAGERPVHRQVRRRIAPDTLLVAQRLLQRLAQRDADILGRVVEVDMQVALRFQLDVDQAMARKLLEHVIQETNAGCDPVSARAVEVHGGLDRGFFGVALDGGGTGHGLSPVVLGTEGFAACLAVGFVLCGRQ